ncbi:hypothetical protein [Actinoplanes sp. NPDC051494]
MEHERARTCPDGLFAACKLLGLPYPEVMGGSQPYEVYVQLRNG